MKFLYQLETVIRGAPPENRMARAHFLRNETGRRKENALLHTDAPAQGDEVSPSARKPKRGAGSSTAQSAETVRSEPSPSLPDLRLRSPALFQNCGGIIERFTGHDKNALSKALLRIADRLSTHMDDRVQLAFKMNQYMPRTSMPEVCLAAS